MEVIRKIRLRWLGYVVRRKDEKLIGSVEEGQEGDRKSTEEIWT